MKFESYHGDDPLKQMRQIKNLDCLSDEQCLDLHREMQSRDWRLTGCISRVVDPKYHAHEIAYQKVRWLINRARDTIEAELS